MTVENGEDEIRPGAGTERPNPSPSDAGHLDEDAEALEDPVHAGDAIHQHDLHQQRRPPVV